MPVDRRKAVAGVLGGVLVGVVVYQVWPRTPVTNGAPRTAAGVASRPAADSGGEASSPDVRLEALQAGRPEPGNENRNLFRFRPAPPPPPPPPTSQGGSSMAPPPTVPSGPPPPPPLPPIALKFIGIVEAPERKDKIAVLSDTRGVYHGREGDIIEGRYRILRIGVESIELAYTDGRGRQTIRLSGS